MKNTSLRSLLTFSALLALSGRIYAADPVEVPWHDLCRVADGRQIEVTTSTGETIVGYCASASADEVGLRSENRIVKIARSQLSHILVNGSERHHLASLGHGVRKGLKNGVKWLLSPLAVAGMVTIPATLAWGAVSAPFCALGDLRHRLEGKQEIKLI